MAEFNLLQNLHLCTQKSVCATNFGPLGEIGANFSLQFSSRTQFAKISNKKVIAENQCEKHKKSSLDDRDIHLYYALVITLSTRGSLFHVQQARHEMMVHRHYLWNTPHTYNPIYILNYKRNPLDTRAIMVK